MANRISPQSPPMREQIPNHPRLAIENPLGLAEQLPEQEMTPSPVAPNESDVNLLGLFYRVDIESLNDWARVTPSMRRSIGYLVQEPDVTEHFKQFLIIMYGSNWEKTVLPHQTMIVKRLFALITGFGKLTSRMKRAWLKQFDSCTSRST